MTWATELAKNENATLRIQGNVAGIITKYSSNTGEPVWKDIPLEEVMPLIETSYLGWNDVTWLSLRGFLDGRANLTFTQAATRQAFAGVVSNEELENVREIVGGRQTLAESLGLNLEKAEIVAALETIIDTPQYERKRRKEIIESIVARYRAGVLGTLPLDQLETVNALLGG